MNLSGLIPAGYGVAREEMVLSTETPEQKAAEEAQRYFIAAQTLNERRIWTVLGPVMLIGSIAILLMWQYADLPTSGLVIFLVGGLGILYTGLLTYWRGPIPTWLAFILVSLEGCLAPVILWSDANFNVELARESSAAGVAFVAVALAGLRYRPWLVVYAGLLGGGLTALGYPAFCPGGADDAIFCHPGLYWWRPVFLLLVAFAGALTVSAALKTFSVTERTIYEKEETGRLAAAKQRFLASVTHELRTPLNSILVLSKLLKDSEEQSPKGREQAGVIYNAGSSLLALINDILDLSKIEAGAMTLAPQPVNLGLFAKELEALFQPIAAEKKLAFVVRHAPGTPKQIDVDRLRLDQILRNLVGNALKFTDAGRVTVMIHPVDQGCINRLLNKERAQVIANHPENYLAFSVRDTGLGISEEVQSRIFSAFVQADDTTAQRFGGTGLGLSICRQLTALMGGELGLESSEGLGATFSLILPISMAQPLHESTIIDDVTLIESHHEDDDHTLYEATDPGTAATTRIRNEVLRTVVLPSLHTTEGLADEAATFGGRPWGEVSSLADSPLPVSTLQKRVVIIAHEDVLTNYRVASALEAVGLKVISRTSEMEIRTLFNQGTNPDLLLVSPDLKHLAQAFSTPAVLICPKSERQTPVPEGIEGILVTPVESGQLHSVLRNHLLGEFST